MRRHPRTGAMLFALLCGGSTLEIEWHATQDVNPDDPASSTNGWGNQRGDPSVYEGQMDSLVSQVTDGAGGAFVVGYSTAGTVKLGGSSITVGPDISPVDQNHKIVLARVSSEVANTNKG